MVLILFDSYQRNIRYDRAKLKKVGNFYALTWLIFAGPVTNEAHSLANLQYLIHTLAGTIISSTNQPK